MNLHDPNVSGIDELISVVIPTFNGARHIVACVQSVLAQPIRRLEVIVADGGSSDDTINVVRGIADDRVTVVAAGTRIPVEENWTRACELSSGTFVKLLCQDDLVSDGALAEQVDLLRRFPSAVAAVGPRAIIDDESRVLMARRGARGLDIIQSGRVALRKTMLAGGNILGEPSAVLFRSEPMKQCLPWSTRFPYMLDLEYYARILQLGDVVCSDNVVASFRVHRGSWSVELGNQQVHDFCRWGDWLIDSCLVDAQTADRTRTHLAARMNAMARRIVYRLRVK